MSTPYPWNIELDLERVHPDAPLPAYGSDGACGFDLSAWWDGPETFKILRPRQTLMVGCGWKFGLPHPYGLFVLPRSGLGAKQGVVIGNLVGLIDTDYEGQTSMMLWNRGAVDRVITLGQKVCQAVPLPIPRATFRVVPNISKGSARGAGGYGSTDKAANA